MARRYITDAIEHFSWNSGKMAFVAGPRQCGKTTLAKQMLSTRKHGAYHNWDDIEFRRVWKKSPKDTARMMPESARALIVYDELHKAKGWKSTLKGIFDTLEPRPDMLVTGSARLNVYRRGGDSLLGRYFLFRLHPFSLGELCTPGQKKTPEAALAKVKQTRRILSLESSKSLAQILQRLIKHSGFPEPYLKASTPFTRLWRMGRVEKLIREDLRDLSRLPELSQVEMLAALLPERAGGLLSLQALREDMEVAHTTVSRWLRYMSELYYHYEIKPFSKSIPRSLKRQSKLYLWDWSEIPNAGNRFENLIAGHLLKACHYWTDTGQGHFELHYLRDKQQNEIDFLITEERKPWLAIEVKLNDTTLAPSFRRFLPLLGNPPFLQLVAQPGIHQNLNLGQAQGKVVSAADWLSTLP